MHPDEIDIDETLARGLVREQFPKWADLPMRRIASTGTDHAIYRLGADKALRLPRYPGPGLQAVVEAKWLPRLAPLLPLAVPIPLGTGVPSQGYPWHWSVHPWFDGESASPKRIADPRQAADDLGRFVVAMRNVDLPGGPTPGPDSSGRGTPLSRRDSEVRGAIAALGDEIESAPALTAWEHALGAPPWTGPAVWLHGDLHEGNLIARQGRLTAVIDFGTLAMGDPACDVMTAWLYLPDEARETFRNVVAADDATWARARGWALSVALIALPYYRSTNPRFADVVRRVIRRVLEDREVAR